MTYPVDAPLPWHAGLTSGIEEDEHRPRIWTVEAWHREEGRWSDWSTWLDRATAEDELANAREQGHTARIVRAS